jgi:hypothetical protein
MMFAVDDTVPPVIACPADIGASTNSGSSTAAVNYSVTATDNQPGVTVSCDTPSGSNFPIGVTTVTCTAVDTSNNKATCSFHVTVAGTNALHLSSSNYTVNEGCTTATVTVTRDNPAASGTATVDVATSDGSASQENRYGMTSARLAFGPGVTSQTFQVVINDNNYMDGNGTINLALSNPQGGVLAGPSLGTLTIIDDDVTPPTSNINDSPGPFVCQQYHDFLSRDPDAAGAAFWTNQIAACGGDQGCVNGARTDASKAFFQSAEFKDTGFFVYLVNKAAYGTLPLYVPFQNDRSRVVGGANLAQSQQDYVSEFVTRTAFAQLNTLPVAQYVDTLNNNTGNSLSAADRNNLLNALSTGTMTRAQVLFAVTQNAAFQAKENNTAFVLMQYFGYLRRDPDSAGLNFWINVLNTSNNARGMVCSFLTAREYMGRFSSVMTHSNSECSNIVGP